MEMLQQEHSEVQQVIYNGLYLMIKHFFSFSRSLDHHPVGKKKNEVLAMVKQLGMPTWFMTLSCADLRRKELLIIICKCHHVNLSQDELTDLSYDAKCKLLNLNPVITARHYQYRVETFFK